jgi:hypothetical protein
LASLGRFALSAQDRSNPPETGGDWGATGVPLGGTVSRRRDVATRRQRRDLEQDHPGSLDALDADRALGERCPGKEDEPLEMGVPQWREDSGEGLINKFGDATIFRLTPDVWEPVRVCAAREVGVLSGERAEYAELSRAFEANPVIAPGLGTKSLGARASAVVGGRSFHWSWNLWTRSSERRAG